MTQYFSNTEPEQVQAYVLTNETLTPQTAAQLGQLMLQLDPVFGGEPVASDYLQGIIDSPYHDQLLASDTLRDKIVGAATLSILMEPGFAKVGSTAHLGGVVVDGTYRGSEPASIWYSPATSAPSQRVAEKIWWEMLAWGKQRNIKTVIFESELYREAAQKFYRRMGAVPLEDTVPFSVDIASAYASVAC